MKNKTLGFIGGGRITKVFLQAFANKNQHFKAIVVYDTNKEVVSGLKNQFPDIRVADDPVLAAKQDVVFIALHPPVIMGTLAMIKDIVPDHSVVISLAPKITIEKISHQLGRKNIVRLLPNATSYINEGYNPICFSSGMDVNMKSLVMDLLVSLGQTFEVKEPKLESYAIISAMLPTYFWFQWEEIRKIGVSTGLSDEESKTAIYESLLASLNLMYRSELSFDQVVDLIPVKPIGEYEALIKDCFTSKLLSLFEKIKAV